MLKTKSIYIFLGGLLAMLPAAALAQSPGGVTTQYLANGTTVFLTGTGTWQLDDWNKETNIARNPADGSVYAIGTFSGDGGASGGASPAASPAAKRTASSPSASSDCGPCSQSCIRRAT